MTGFAISSPLRAEVAGKLQLRVQTQQTLAGVDPRTRDVLWNTIVPSYRGSPRPLAGGIQKVASQAAGCPP